MASVLPNPYAYNSEIEIRQWNRGSQAEKSENGKRYIGHEKNKFRRPKVFYGQDPPSGGLLPQNVGSIINYSQ